MSDYIFGDFEIDFQPEFERPESLPTFAWYNFKTGQHEDLHGQPENIKDYIPQEEKYQAMFDELLEQGQSQQAAAIAVHTAYLESNSES